MTHYHTDHDDLLYEPDATSTTQGMLFAVVALIGLLGGIGLGLFYSWRISPAVERNTLPNQLRDEDRRNYIIAVALDYAYTSNLDRAYTLLTEVDPNIDPFQLVADTACEMTRAGDVQTSADIQAMLHLIAIFNQQPDVRVDCDLSIYATSPPSTAVVTTPTITLPPSLTPVATKTTTPDAPRVTPPTVAATTPAPTTASSSQEYSVLPISQFCDPDNSGVIEVYVQESGESVPGVRVTVLWNTSTGQTQQSFYTGLKPNRGDGYADFQMEEGIAYQVRLGRSEVTDRLEAGVCDEAGTLRSYQVIFRAR